MKLLRKSDETRLVNNHKKREPIAFVKFFNPCGIGTWYLSELDPETNIAFGLCDLGYPELGYVSIDELKETDVGFGLKIERDMYFTPKKLSELKK